jgi:hypothetical protein
MPLRFLVTWQQQLSFLDTFKILFIWQRCHLIGTNFLDSAYNRAAFFAMFGSGNSPTFLNSIVALLIE